MRIAVLVGLLVSSVAVARPALPYSVAVTPQGSALAIALHNRSQSPIVVTTHVRAGIDHFDMLGVTLTDATGTKRNLTFSETRTKSVAIDETIAGGGTITELVDLQDWAVRSVNGGTPLAPGDYTVDATWSGEVASTKLTIAAPVEKRCTDAWNTTPRRGTAPPALDLLARQIGNTAEIEVGVHNFDTVAHCVMAYVKTYEQQSDWLHVAIGQLGISFNDTRDASVLVAVELPPGATTWTRWDLAAWAARDCNGKHKLPSGTQMASITYDATRDTEGMAIQLSTSIAITIP